MTQRISYQELPANFTEGLQKNELYIKKSGLDLKLVELIKHRVSQINRCAYCLDMHHKEAIHLGESELRLHTLPAFREAPFYSDKEKTALAFAEALTHANHEEIEDDMYNALTRFFTKEEIATLTLVVTQINSWNRINKVFRFTPGNYRVNQFENKKQMIIE